MEPRKTTGPLTGAKTRNRRKTEHVLACLDDGVDRSLDSFAAWKLRYNALPDLSLEAVATASTFCGQAIAAPIIISAMTGGADRELARLNRNLAEGAEALGLPLSLGSAKVALEDSAARDSFRLRQWAPTVPLIANLGLVSFNYDVGLEALDSVRELVEPDVFGLHLNALQEAIQEGGDTDFRGMEDHLRAIRQACPLPLLVKECGGGLAPEVVGRLAALGVDYIDVSGADGTSWAAVEGQLSADPSLGELFRDFGLPTAWILEHLTAGQRGAARIIAGGGIRNGLQAAKALALGARYVSVARPFLLAANDSAEAVVALGQRLMRELRTAMFLSGAGDLNALRREQLLRL